MKHTIPLIFTGILSLLLVGQARAQVQAFNCQTSSDDNVLTGEVFFNYGSLTDAYSLKNRSSLTVGESVVGEMQSATFTSGLGFWSRYLLTPSSPIVLATEGDLPDRIRVSWMIDPLSPSPNLGFKVYRNGDFLANIDNTTFDFVDFNVIAGESYTYTIYGLNDFGLGFGGTALGFVNPNGVVTGSVKTLNGNPVPGTAITLTPTIGTALGFNGMASAFTEYQPAYPRNQFSLSLWVKIGSGNDATGMLDLGSSIAKNWWIHTTPTASGKGVTIGIGHGAGDVHELSQPFPAATADDWHYVAATYNGSSLLLYLDGELVSTTVAQITADSMPLFFGKKSDGTGFFNGKMDEVRIFDRQLSQTELQMLMNKTASSNTTGLFSYWKFDEGTGVKSFNISANKITAYLCGAGWTSDKPDVLNAGITNEQGFYTIEGVNYGSGKTFTARAIKNFYNNQSLEFNGVNAQSAALTDFDLSDSSTIDLTAKGFDFAGNECLLSKQNGGTTLFTLNLNAGHLVLEMGGSTHDFGLLGMGFHRLSLVIKQTGGSAEVTFYKDGTLIGANTYSGVATDFSGGTAWTLGAKRTAGVLGNYFSGLIDEVAFFNTLLSLGDIQTAANIGTNVTHVHLQNYFPLNEGSGTELVDYGLGLSGKGTVVGATWSTVAGIAQSAPHLFTPSTRLVTLNPSNTSADQIDFTDQSTVPVSGYVRFDGTTCFQKGVEILVNGSHFSPPVFTDSTGYFVVDFEPGATAKLTPTFKNHSYFPAFWEVKNLASPVAGILFRNQTQRHIQGQMAGNAICRKSVIPTGAIVKVKVETLDGCYYKELQLTEENGKFKFDHLPPLPMTVAVTEHSNNVIYNYFQLKGGQTVDLTDVSDTTDFIYYSQPEIEIAALDTNSCGQQMLQQSEAYTTEIRVYQSYDGGVCYLDTALLHIDNGIMDKPAFDTLMTNGKFKYKFYGGLPLLAPPYMKTLTVLATANELENTATTSAVVLGKRPRLTNFTSTSPKLPIMILRDPPGDASSATIEKGKTVCNGWSIGASASSTASAELGISLGIDTEISTGIGVEKTTKVEIGNTTTFGMSATISSNINHSVETCITTNEVFSTSDGDEIIGADADLYVGGALNLLFGVTDDLRYDTAHCDYFIHPGVVVFPDKFSTTFIYSDYQIRNVVIPNLELIGDTTSAHMWQNILQRNADLKAQAIFQQNYSFDAGVTYENSTTIENTKSLTYGFGAEITASIANELGIMVDGNGVTGTISLELTMGIETEFSSTTTNSQTVGFTFADDDIGDNYTVNVLRDPVYGTPVFKTISGNSSCPYEPNTVPRDGVTGTVDQTVASNVPMNAPAVFHFSLGNQSQTNEEREYFLKLLPSSNPLGAVVKIQGQSGAVPFTVPFGESQDVIVEIERGPMAFDYDNLQFAYFADCEGETSDNPEFSKIFNLSVHFLEPCSPIDLGFPLQNWVFTPADGSTMFITLNEFDRTDPDLELIRVQYRRTQGDGAWINIAEVPKGDLDNPVFKIVPWFTTGLQDGLYEIRAVTQCFGGQNAGISHIINGRFEREPPALFGTPEPADGILSIGDEISIQFTEPIRCDQLIQADFFNNNNVGLYDAETGNLVDATISCNGDKITIVPNVPNRFIENKVLRVEVDNIQDLAGNNFLHKQWEFFVDRNPLNWVDQSAIKVIKYEEDFVSLTRKLENRGGQATDYTITGTPDWVRVFPKAGTLAPGGVDVITFEFDSTMTFGAYADTLLAEGALGDEPLKIDARVVCHTPDWSFNLNNYAYSTNFTLELNIEGVTSIDEEDLVAAFIGNELRGLAKVQYVPAVNKYLAFLTVYSNDFSGGDIEMQIWDASACSLFGEVIEDFVFEADDLIGTPTLPQVIHTNSLILRRIPLHQGWNWLSFNLAFPDPSLNAAFASLANPEDDLVKSQTQFSQNYAGVGWLGSLAALNNTSMFQYRTAEVDTLSMIGAPIDPAALSIPVVTGWNWIGYVPQYPLPVNVALATLPALNGDLIKSQTQFSQYVSGFGWIGNLAYMEAPNGYLLKMTSPGAITYPAQPPPLAPTEAEERGENPPLNLWTVNAASYELNSTLIGILQDAEGHNITAENLELGAFVNGEVRGSSQAMYIEPLNAWMFFLTTYANTPGELVRFKMFNGNEINDLGETLYFTADAQNGTVQQPFVFGSSITGTQTLDGTKAHYLDIQPNPLHEQTTFRYSTGQAELVNVTVSSALGSVLVHSRLQAQSGENQLLWTARTDAGGSLPGGVYFVKIQGEKGGVVLVKKMVVE